MPKYSEATSLPITNSKLDLGTWLRIFYAEFGGQRSKRVIVKILGIDRHALTSTSLP
jgi:thiamine phosphate synthase YjbQ (UPF0047 family)